VCVCACRACTCVCRVYMCVALRMWVCACLCVFVKKCIVGICVDVIGICVVLCVLMKAFTNDYTLLTSADVIQNSRAADLV